MKERPKRALVTEGHAKAVELTDETGCFWFTREDNLEVFLKVLDGCAITDCYWVFVAGLTNVEVFPTYNPDLGIRFPL